MKHLSHPKISKSTAPPCDCQKDPIQALKEMFVDQVQMGRIKKGQCPARRPVFLRLHGVAHGTFEIESKLSQRLREGLFGRKASYPAWVRFSSDIPDGFPDLNSTVGIGIKLFGVPGKKGLPPDETAPTFDFLMQNIDVFFVNNAREMCEFTKASLTSSEALQKWLDDHPRTSEILDRMKKKVPTALGIDFWSVIPFRFGKAGYCKYKLVPETPPKGSKPDYDDPNYLRVDLAERLQNGAARFKFMVQLQTDPEKMPLDEATVSWSERLSPPIHAATLILPKQDVSNRGQSAYGETLAFNPWRTPLEHQPAGSLAEARKIVYQASADLRRNVNGQPLGEPREPRPAESYPPARDSHIVRAAIHPGIGIARIGNSRMKDGYYIGPEVTEPEATQSGQTRDAKGAIKRQAARFRIYGYNAAGEVVGEIDANDADIQWTAHLANKKAQWYQFQAALDIPEAKNMSVPLRNKDVRAAYRSALVIDPGPRSIEGRETSGKAHQFDGGAFMGTPVPLGEIRTDSAGRLLVLGGHGESASPKGMPVFDPANPDSFNNANGWFDDTSDGPVTAKVTMAGRDIPVEPAWVVVAPPNYAPDVIGWRTLHDLLTDAYVECGWLPYPQTVSFARDILPILRRLSNLQWVNKGFAAMFGKGAPMDFEDPDFIAKLAFRPKNQGEPDPHEELRRAVFNSFRPADNAANDRRAWPWIYGDAFGSFNDSPDQNLGLSKIRSKQMRMWVEGNFINDWNPKAVPPRAIEQVPLAEQPAMLDQAALHFCLADAFHPGCELTWPMRHTTLYSAPFRIRHRSASDPEPFYGNDLTQAIALQPGGPLYAQGPGDLSRWMALPWQGDTAFCRSGYDVEYDPYLPTFWPARVPNQVLTAEDYATVMKNQLPREERIAAFNNRLNWLRSLTGSTVEQMEQMIASFGKMGIVEARKGVKNDPDFPAIMWVESLAPDQARQIAALKSEREAEDARHGEDDGLRRRLSQAGWESVEQMREFRELMKW